MPRNTVLTVVFYPILRTVFAYTVSRPLAPGTEQLSILRLTGVAWLAYGFAAVPDAI